MNSLYPIGLAAWLLLWATHAGAEDLLDIYRLAQQQATGRAQAQAAAGAAAARYRQARAGLLPNINANASYGKLRQEQRFEGAPSGGLGFGDDDQNDDFEEQQSVNLSLEQPLFDWSAWQAKGAAADRHKSALFELSRAEQALITESTSRYFDVLAAGDAFAAAEQRQDVIKRQLDRSEAEFEAGITPITDRQEAASQLDAARVEAIQARNQLNQARNALRQLIGRLPGELAGLPARGTPQPPDTSVNNWVERALTNSPAVAAAQRELQAAERDIRRQRGGHYPRVDLVGRVGETEQVVNFPIPGAGSTEFNSITETQSVAVELSVPIFAGGATSAAVAEAEYLREQAFQELVVARRQAELDTRTAFDDFTAAAARVTALDAAIASGQTAVEAARAGLQTGTRNVLDVLEAEIELLDRRVRRKQGWYDYFTAELRLRQAAGVLSIEQLQVINQKLEQGASIPSEGPAG